MSPPSRSPSLSDMDNTIPHQESGRREQSKMIRLTVEVHNGAARFRVGISAKSIPEALALVGESNPQRKCLVKFPARAEVSFAATPATRTATVERPERLAA
jgi:hypothetical protein